MANKTYIAREGQNIYDMAVVLYGDARGVTELIQLNPDVFTDLDAEDYVGQSVAYDDAITFEDYVAPVVIPVPAKEKTWLSHVGQSVYDIALQFYGDLSGLGKVMRSVSDLDAIIPAGSSFQVDIVSEPNVSYFAKRGIVPVSVEEDSAPPMVGDFRLLENGDFRLLENGDFRLLE